MKCQYKNCSFVEFFNKRSRSWEILGLKNAHRGITLKCTLDDGSEEIHWIASITLEKEMQNHPNNEALHKKDESISYYAEDNEMIYDILEAITNEKIS